MSILKPVLGSQLQLGHPLAQDLVGCWLMNEGCGNKVADLSGNKNNGTLYNDTHFVPGKFGSALDFDGTGDYVDCGDAISIATDDFSVSVWIKVKGDGGIDPYKVVNEQISGNGWGITYKKATDKFGFGDPNTETYTTSTILNGYWYHVVGVYKGINSTIYLNGIEESSADGAITFQNIVLRLAEYANGSGYGFNGQIDNLLIYNRVLSSSEIRQLYLSPFCMFEREPIELWTATAASAGAVDVTVEPSTLELAVTQHAPVIGISITTWAGLHTMRNNLAGEYILDADLDENSAGYATYAGPAANGGLGWEPIGATFIGTLNFAGHTISDLYIDRPATAKVGLFRRSSAATIQNVVLKDVDVTGDLNVGALIGEQVGGSITQCSATGVINAREDCGGLIGKQDIAGTATLCHTDIDVNVTEEGAGGLIGWQANGYADQCFSVGPVDGVDGCGGLIGLVGWGSNTNCYSHGAVTGTDTVGGLIGSHVGGVLSKCYSSGEVTGDTNVGGLVGDSGIVPTDCFWDTQTSGQAGSDGGTGKTTAQMFDDATFTETDTPGLTNPWDFVGNPHDDVANEDYWDIDNYYPFLTVLGDPYVLIEPVTLTLALTQYVPTVVWDSFVLPDTLVLALTQHAPTIAWNSSILPATFALAVTLHTPDILFPIQTMLPTTFELEAILRTSDAMSGYPEMTPAMRESLIDPYAGGAWLWLAEIWIPGYDLIRLARNTEDVVYAGVTYTAHNFDIGMAPLAGDGSIPRYGLRVAQDGSYILEDRVNDTKGACGGQIKIIRAHEDHLAYFIEELEQLITILTAGSDAKYVNFVLGIPDPLLRKIPLRRFSSKKCPYALPGLFKGVECGYSGNDSTCTGKLEDCVAKGNEVRWGGELGLDPNVARV